MPADNFIIIHSMRLRNEPKKKSKKMMKGKKNDDARTKIILTGKMAECEKRRFQQSTEMALCVCVCVDGMCNTIR